jgi:hypothetical protein
MFRFAKLCVLAGVLGLVQPTARAAGDWMVPPGCEFVESQFHDGVSAAHDGLSADGYQRLLDRKERTAKRNRAGLWQESDLSR